MEKFKPYADAATGINPFVLTHQRTAFSSLLSIVTAPLRLLVVLALLVAIFLVDTIFHIFRVAGLGFLAQWVFYPINAIFCRLLLLVLANVWVRGPRWYPARPSPSIFVDGKRADDGSSKPQAGDVILCNLQSPLDFIVLCCVSLVPTSFGLPMCWCAFYSCKCCNPDPLSRPDDDPDSVVAFGPSPLQKINVMKYIFYTASVRFLGGGRERFAESAGFSGTFAKLSRFQNVDLSYLQRRAQKMGMPLLFFAEGTCTNGKGLLQFPNIICEPKMQLVTLTYSSTAVNSIIHSPTSSLVRFLLFSCPSLLHGVPLIPTETCDVTITRPSSTPQTPTDFSPSATNLIRTTMAQGVVHYNRRAVLKPLDIGAEEKYGFANAWFAAMEPQSPVGRSRD